MLDIIRYAIIAYIIFFVTSVIFAVTREKQKKYNSFTTGEQVLKNVDLSGKTAIVTGSSAGLGKETTRVLVKKGCMVYMACRNVAKAEQAKKDIINALKNENIKNINEKMTILKIDLSSLQSVQDFARKVLKDGIKVDYLINNAGVMGLPKYKETENNIEFQFGVNHIGHFYMTQLLLPLLKENKTRIINLSSWGHKFAPFQKTKELFEYCIKHKSFYGDMKHTYTPFYAYGISKSCNILFTRQLNKLYRKDGIYACAVHPGGIFTELARDVKLKDFLPFLLMTFTKPYHIVIDMKNIQRGVSTTLRCVGMTNEEIEKSLYCYYQNCGPVEPFNYSAAKFGDNQLQEGLWQLSRVLIKEKGFELEL